ncbi:MAG: tRNA uridine(34) 5-carboxymethylaminomethyl modification radical SAM/GNAT enzyme Elp3, partial [Candidatus Moranbacteria bacterium]|nr:tRNA uridine(34) 5-carboxymethylaminomethyl modification radical SAM/GNAT enzyme Elp3 [Candidatus Moranbacteria bacterium]
MLHNTSFSKYNFIMQLIHQNFILSIINSGIKTSADFSDLKKKFYSQNKSPQPTNADLREEYERMINQRKIKRNPILEKAMQSRGVRTQSGVAVVAVLTKPSSCPGKCLYCPTEKGMPKSYLSNEPAVMRAITNKFDPYRQVQSRLKALELNGHITDKIELIVMGGTFSYFPKAYQKKFITECFRAANEYSVGKNNELRIKNQEKDTPNNKLFKEQKRNEKTKHRIIGLTLETRPDYIDAKEIKNFRELGCTRVELGVQSIFDDILELNKRGHNISETIRATKLLKDAGFKINYHIMPGLLGSSLEKDIAMFADLFSNSDFQPDMLKIYPTVVIKDSELYAVWKKGDYKPLTDKQFEELIIE